MAEYPPTSAERTQLRAAHRTRILASAERAARLYGLSIRCELATNAAWPTHDCRNDGTTCLCACHDRTDGTP